MTNSVETGLRQLDGFLRLLKSRVPKCRDAIRMTALEQRSAIQMRMRSFADAETRRRIAEGLAPIAESLRDLVADGATGGGMHVSNAADGMELEVTAKAAAVSLVRLAQFIARQRFLGLREDRLSRIAPVAARRVLISGFDRGALDDFVARYWFDVAYKPMEPGSPLRFTESGLRTEEITLVPLIDLGLEVSPLLVQEHSQPDATVFLLVDAHQIGSTHSQLARSQSSLPELFGSHIRTVLVIQSVRDLLEGDEVAAGLWELRRMIGKLGLSVYGVLANDDSSLFSELADTLVLARRPMATLSDEVAWLSTMGLDEQDKVAATGILRDWRAFAAGRSKGERS